MGIDKFALPDPNAVPNECILPMMAHLAALQSALAARLMLLIHEDTDKRAQVTALDEGELLTAEQAAGLLSVTTHWMYRHASRLPFARRLSRKALRFSKAGLFRWRDARRG